MDNKFYVSYEAARLLKEKGYKEDVSCYYDEDGFLHFLEYDENYNYFQMSNNDLDLDHYAAPTKTEAIDWLESKGIGISIIFCEIDMYEYVVEFKDCYYNVVESGYKETRLEAEEAAIIGALKLL